jgi:hypothetical protein
MNPGGHLWIRCVIDGSDTKCWAKINNHELIYAVANPRQEIVQEQVLKSDEHR